MLMLLPLIISTHIGVFGENNGGSGKGLNIDINYRNDSAIGKVDGSFSGQLVESSLPVPFLFIRPNELENVHQIAESALVSLFVLTENESIIAETEDVYEHIISELENRSPEEMVTDIIAKINKLEALKAQLGTEERIARLKLSNVNSTFENSVPVSHPVEVNPNNQQ